MKLAIISDIHSNLEALIALERYLSALDVDEIISLGDIVGYGADPNPCIDFIRANVAISVRGNHDAAVTDPSLINFFTQRAAVAARWTIGQLTPDNLRYLVSLPLIKEAYDCTFVHSSPSQPDEWEYLTHHLHVRSVFPFFSTPLCFIGHTHIPALFGEETLVTSIERGKKYVINPGSIGQPRDGDPRSCFGILDTAEWTFTLTRVEYDVNAAATKIIRAGLPRVLAERLYYGT